MNLESAGVRVDEQGFIAGDAKRRTSNKKIFAAGDATRLQFTHHADAQARAPIQNALFFPTAKSTDSLFHTAPIPTQKSPSRIEEDQLQAAGTLYEDYETYFDDPID